MTEVGPWNVLDTIAIADCAPEIHADDLDDLFATAARALDLLLHDWLSDLIFLKDFPGPALDAAARGHDRRWRFCARSDDADART